MIMRPKEYDGRVQLQFRLEPKLKEKLQKEAKRRQVSTNYLLETALEEALTKWAKEKL
jgi:predicted HicB family RNase H-like nuclease